jgi:hypothetical protein
MLEPAGTNGEAAMKAWTLWTAALGLALAAGAALGADHAELLPEDPAKEAVVATCTACHDATEITTRRMDADAWDSMVSKMMDLGAEVSDEDRPRIVAYLGKYFSRSSPPPPPPREPVVNPPPPSVDAPASATNAPAPATTAPVPTTNAPAPATSTPTPP